MAHSELREGTRQCFAYIRTCRPCIRMQAAARRIQLMIPYARACREYALAFGHHANSNSTTLDMCVIHNSIVSLENGKPWQEVNYSHMRRARWLCDQSYKASRLVDAWYTRKCRS